MRNLKNINNHDFNPFILLSAGDFNSGKEKPNLCSCHGVDGISQIKTYPILAGQIKTI